MGKRGAFIADHVAGGPDGDKQPVSPVTNYPAAAKPGDLTSASKSLPPPHSEPPGA